jgi:hypothetical protein
MEIEITREVEGMEITFHIDTEFEEVSWDKHLRTPEENIAIGHWLDQNWKSIISNRKKVSVRINTVYIGTKNSSLQEFILPVDEEIFTNAVRESLELVEKIISKMVRKTTQRETEAYGGIYNVESWEIIHFPPRQVQGSFEMELEKHVKGADNI